MLRHFSSASSYEAIAELCGVPVGTVRSRLNAARGRLADELLATAAQAHRDHHALRDQTLAAGRALSEFERSGDRRLLESVFSPEVSFRMADKVERVAVVELLLDSPPEQPLHCPPAVTQLHFHCAGRTHRLISYYAPRR